MLCAGVQGSRRSERVANNFSHVSAAVPKMPPASATVFRRNKISSATSFVKTRDPKKINKAPIFSWLLAARSQLYTNHTVL